MKLRNPKAAFLVPLALLLLLPLAVSGQQAAGPKAAEEYQARQRALSLILFDSKIKSLDDAPMRCIARREILAFLVESGPRDLHPYAYDFAMACLEETSRNAEEFYMDSAGNHTASILRLVRKADPLRAERLEIDFPIKGFAKYSAHQLELKDSDDPVRVTAKVITEIRSGEIPPNLGGFVSSLRKRDAGLADSVLDAVLVVFERDLSLGVATPEIVFVSYNFLAEPVPESLRNRFLTLILNLGRRALADRSNEEFVRAAVAMLSTSDQAIEQHLPANVDEARSIAQTLQGSLSETESERKDILDRINKSEDKLAAAISEAEKAEDGATKSFLWRMVSNLALNENELRVAIDASFKIEALAGEGWRLFLLTEAVPRKAVQSDDLETVDYVLERLEEAGHKAQVDLFVASLLLEKDRKEEAVRYFRQGLDILGDARPGIQTFRQFAKAVELSITLNDRDVFSVAREATAAVNRLPSASAEAIKGSEEQAEYVYGTLSQAGNSVAKLFELLAERDPDQAYTISQGIQRRDLRLMAEIAIEKFKKYPLPGGKKQEQDEQDK